MCVSVGHLNHEILCKQWAVGRYMISFVLFSETGSWYVGQASFEFLAQVILPQFSE